MDLYVPYGSLVCDVTYGTGAFWRGYRHSYNLVPSDIQTGIDCRDLPYSSSSVDCVILDPPYVYSPKGTIKKSISTGYALNAEKGGELLASQSDVLDLYLSAIREAHRVLVDKGILIIKTKDVIQSGRQWWMHTKLMCLVGFECIDLFILTQKVQPAMDPKWTRQLHARKNHSYFIVQRKK